MPDPRGELVQALRDRGVIRTIGVATAFAEVARELFIPEIAAEGGLERVYRDEAYITKKDSRGTALSSSSQPGMMAAMLELLAPEPGQRVLEIGAGTGYNAALLKRLVGPAGELTTIDVDPEITARARRALHAAGEVVEIVVGDGRGGFAASAPYDGIIVTASARELPAAWLEQLVPGGRLVVPIRLAADAEAFDLIPVFVRVGELLRATESTWGGFMPLHGGEGPGELSRACLSAKFSSSGEQLQLMSITGAGIERLTPGAARRLLSAAVAEPTQTRPGGVISLGASEPPGALIYLATRIPANRRVWVRHSGRHGVGLIGARAGGIAALTMPSIWASQEDGEIRWRLDGWGRSDAFEQLGRLADRWSELERAGRDQLELTARPAGDALQLRFSWTRRRADARTPASA